MIIEKRCTRCRQVKSVTDFYRKGASKDGYASLCKECKRSTDAAWYRRNRRRELERMRAYKAANREVLRVKSQQYRSANAAAIRAHYARYRRANPEKEAAQTAVSAAVRGGLLLPVTWQPCRHPKCDRMADAYHHWSYAEEHQLSVVPLCHHHHRLVHSGGWKPRNIERLAATMRPMSVVDSLELDD